MLENSRIFWNLRRKKADYIWNYNHIYDIFLHKHDPLVTTDEVDQIFQELNPKLKNLISRINKPSYEFIEKFDKSFDQKKILQACNQLIGEIGYDFQRWRLDSSVHPFTWIISPNDVRVTTKVYWKNLIYSALLAIHEMGHAICEFNKDKEWFGLPSWEINSYAIHESQSMFFERFLAKQEEFQEAFFPILKDYFPEELKEVSYKDLMEYINFVQPSLIRLDADQLTYHMHIIIRYEIEKSLLEWNLNVNDLPEVWNQKYKDYLGIEPNNLKEWVLQDVHWWIWRFGYFPSYSLGTMYWYCIYENMEKNIGIIPSKIKNRNMQDIINWLAENIHKKWSTQKSIDLINSLGNEKFSVSWYIDFMERRFQKSNLIN